MPEKWLKWSEHPWFSSYDMPGSVFQLCDRILAGTAGVSSATEFLTSELPQISAEFSAQWSAVFVKTPQWELITECGRRVVPEVPFRLFDEALDREGGTVVACNEPKGCSLIVVPLALPQMPSQVLVLSGKSVSADDLPTVWAVARTLAYAIRFCEKTERNEQRIFRYRRTLQTASKFSMVNETQPLLEMIAEEATRLLDCDRASIFVWDKEHQEVVACPALGVDQGTLRLPDNEGIVGEVIHTGRTIRVDDAYNDSRFNKAVDKESGYTTNNLLCVPLMNGKGLLLGAFEGINKNDGIFVEDDEETLTQLGIQAAIALQNTRERELLIRSREQLTAQVHQGVPIIGESPSMNALRSTVDRLASTDLPVLILGESGTGKEVVSRALHFKGARANNPFVAVNCAALTESLLESELFGHEQGAFTDARESRRGKFELADEGTLFLDEIGDMSPGGQAKLLRVLEQKVITRVGGSQPIPIDVRVIAATNSNLAEAVRDKKFRQDLYFRLSVVALDLPPLRERPEDVLPLAIHFLEQFCQQANRPTLELAPDARRRIQAHGWPGNVRELRNLMERVAFLAPGPRVETDDLAFTLTAEGDSAIDLSSDLGLTEATKRFQQEFIRRGIKRVKGNMSEAAKLMGLHRSNLYRKMRQLDMNEAGDFREDEDD